MNIEHNTSAPHRPFDPQLTEKLRTWVHTHWENILADLTDLVAIPGIAFPGYDREPLDRSADAVADLLSRTGFDEIHRLHETHDDGTPGGPAIIVRRKPAPGHKTVLLYAHHDVQPAGAIALWDTDPWKAEEINGRLYGRGTADDKAGIMVHTAAFAALSELLGDDFGVGITIFIEGEEEAGSPTFRKFLETNKALLQADVIVVADASNWAVGTPALTTSLRGLVDGEIQVRVAKHAVHSGMFGGPMLDAATVLARVIAQLHDDEGNVAIPGLEQKYFSDIEYPADEYRQQSGAVDSLQLAGEDAIADALWNKPALNIIGTDITRLSEASNTMIPVASAKFSLRLGPGMDPEQAMQGVTNYIEGLSALGAEVTVKPGELGQPFHTDTTAPAASIMMQALHTAWGVDPVETGSGGSIPFTADLNAVFPDAEVLITGIEDPDTKAHSANESLELTDFAHAIVAEALLLAGLNNPTE